MTNPTSMSEAKTCEVCGVCGREKADKNYNPWPNDRCYIWLGDVFEYWKPTQEQKLAHYSLGYTREKARADGLQSAMERINGIRNSIIGTQSINWSEHIYPLVAALNGAGLVGLSYPEARENVGTLIDRTNAAEARADGLAKELAEAKADAGYSGGALLKEHARADAAEKRLREYLGPSGAPPAQPPAAAPVQEREALSPFGEWDPGEWAKAHLGADGPPTVTHALEVMEIALCAHDNPTVPTETIRGWISHLRTVLAAPLPSAKPQEESAHKAEGVEERCAVLAWNGDHHLPGPCGFTMPCPRHPAESAAPAGRCEVLTGRYWPEANPCGNTLPCPAHPATPAHPGGGK